MENYHGLELQAIKDIVKESCSFDLSKNYIDKEKVDYNPLVINLNNNRAKEALASCVKYGPMPFYGVRDITMILKLAQKDGILTPNDIYSVYNHINCVKGVISYTSKVEGDIENIKDLVSTLEYSNKLANDIINSISAYGDVLDSASQKLKSIRNSMKTTDSKLHQIANDFIIKHSDSLQEKTISSRDNRLTLLVKNSDKNAFGGYIHGESASRLAAYVEPAALISLNNKANSLIYEEREEIENILRELSEKIKDESILYLSNLETLVILDVIYAKATFGYRNNATVPILTKTNHLYLKNARHPLIDKKNVVSNTYELNDDITTLLITGPNTGGKTVSLKIMGLFVVMSYIGIPILVDEAMIPYFDNVYEDITDDQSIIESLSTFSAHLKKLATIVNNASKNSFILIDEIGSGTDPKEGESLAIAIIDELRRRKCKTIVTTHLGKLKTYGKKHDDILIASVQFDSEKMEPTYNYIEGLSGQSNAFEIARRFNLSEDIIQRAIELKSQEVTTEDELLEKLENQILENQLLKDKISEELKEIEIKKIEITKEKNRIESEHNLYVEKANKEADKKLNLLKLEAEEIIDEIKENQKKLKLHEVVNYSSRLDRIEVYDNEDEEDYDNDREFKVSDLVEIKKSNQVGKLVSVNRKNCIININGINVKCKVDDLRHSRRKIEKVKVVKQRPDRRFVAFNNECNVIGLYSEQALETVSRFLDQALLHKATSLRIVHGVGTGVLRKSIHSYLSKSKYVKTYRLADANAGGTGATEVILK
jgi:DNA mismatch repair protein MutS2